MSSVAISDGSGLLATSVLEKGAMHSEYLTPEIVKIAKASNIKLGDLDLIVTDVGPGLFTGLRVGLATAKALAQGLGIPMVGLSSLDILANQADENSQWALCAIDARRGELFIADYRGVPRAPGLVLNSGPRVISLEGFTEFLGKYLGECASLDQGCGSILQQDEPENRIDRPERSTITLIGNGFLELGEEIDVVVNEFLATAGQRTNVSISGDFVPRSETLISMGLNRMRLGQVTEYIKVMPVYLREADAKVGFKQRFQQGQSARDIPGELS